jgi:hypothetical protein
MVKNMCSSMVGMEILGVGHPTTTRMLDVYPICMHVAM